jgi:hypothetical protein
MAEKEVIMTFNWDGTIEKEAKGFEGKSCTEVTDFIEKALSAKNQKKRFKPEYLRQETKQKDTRLRY